MATIQKKVRITRVQLYTKSSESYLKIGQVWNTEEYAPPQNNRMYSGREFNFEVVNVLPGYFTTEKGLYKLEYL